MESLQVGAINLEGGRINYYKPLLLENGRKVAVACGKDIRILEVANGRYVSALNIHKFKVVGLSYFSDVKILSVDSEGHLYRWLYSSSQVQCEYIGKFPIPPTSEVENLAFVGEDDSLVLSVMMNKGVGPRALIYQHDISNMVETYTVLIENVVVGYNTLAFSSKNRWGAVITSNHVEPSFNIIPLVRNVKKRDEDTRKNKRILMGTRTPTSIAIHPIDDIVAVGDDLGGIELYYQVFNNDITCNIRRRFHWHTSPVADMVFSLSGGELFSGGNEGVVVQWFLKEGNEKEKSTLNKLGQPITHLNLSCDNSTLIASHTDNSFSSVDVFQFKLLSVILGQGVGCPNLLSGQKNIPVTTYDNRTGAIVTKSRPGYLHFYHSRSQQQLYLVDIAQENFIGNVLVTERDVTAMSLSGDGYYMATVDSLGSEASKQNLKFWRFDPNRQSWQLDTSIHNPHLSSVKGCLMQPTSETLFTIPTSGSNRVTDHDDISLCLTWSEEGDIKLWCAKYTQGALKWSILHEGTYLQHREATCATWSTCGNVVAVAYGATVTLWTVDSLKCKAVLSKQQLFDAYITSMRFCPLKPHILVTCSSVGIIAWSLLTRSILYHAPLNGICLQSDLYTGLMAVSTEDSQIILFSAEEGMPLQTIDVPSKAVSLQFCPAQSTKLKHSVTKLMYYSQEMDLMSFSIALNGSEFEDNSKMNEHEAPKQSLLSKMIASSKSVSQPTDALFSFTYGERSCLEPDTFKKKINEANVHVHEIDKFDDLFLLLSNKTNS